MTDENNTPAADQETSNALTDEQAKDQFQGFATRDGERIEPDAKPADADRPTKGGETKAKAGDEPAKKDEEGAEDEATQRHKSAQDRINKAVGKQRAAERKVESLEGRLAALEGRAAAGNGQTQPTQTKANKSGEPKPADYEYGELDAGYIRDLAKHEARQEFEAAQSRSKQEQDNASQTKAQEAFQQKLDGFLTKGLDIADDFDEIVRDEDFKVSPTLGELAMESDHGPQILYSAGSDPKEAKRISAMSPARQAAWFGQREAELSSESSDAGEDTETGQQTDTSPDKTSPKTTKAPPPPKGKARGSGETQQVSPATSDFAQFERQAMKQQE